MANVLREHAAAYTVEGREDSGLLRDSAARPIYSAAHCSCVDTDGNSNGPFT